MKTYLNFNLKRTLVIIFASLSIASYSLDAIPLGEFRILKQRNGIDLYYRWMRMPEGNEVRQMKAVLEIPAGPDEVLALLKDEERALDWLPSAEQFRNLTQATGPEWVSYMQFGIPWPFADQDCIVVYSVSKNSQTEVQIDFFSDPDYLSPVKGISRMKDIIGSFVIRPLPNGHSRLECFFLSTKAAKIPVWISDPIITGCLISLMEGLRDELSEV
jgi:hypothetical protein